ncbi:unnamed protein product [Soboliphyme baturini]|uniref:Uncharacterized protein n=1 Tax=Soboliphyme baturini TaxID=241478 RepID=A0A183J933_9BILA|nr:unnamed protein product [Soboliphyme baturini]
MQEYFRIKNEMKLDRDQLFPRGNDVLSRYMNESSARTDDRISAENQPFAMNEEAGTGEGPDKWAFMKDSVRNGNTFPDKCTELSTCKPEPWADAVEAKLLC